MRDIALADVPPASWQESSSFRRFAFRPAWRSLSLLQSLLLLLVSLLQLLRLLLVPLFGLLPSGFGSIALGQPLMLPVLLLLKFLPFLILFLLQTLLLLLILPVHFRISSRTGRTALHWREFLRMVGG